MDELYTPGYINHIAPHGLNSGISGVKKLIQAQMKAFPGWHITVNYRIQHQDKHIVKWTLTGTYTGEYCGVSPTGKRIE